MVSGPARGSEERRTSRPRNEGQRRAAERRARDRERQIARRQARDVRRAARRSELLEAAIGAVRAEGADVSMEAMAAAGGVTKPILYRHFGDRNGLVAAIALEFAGDLQGGLTRSLQGADDSRELTRRTIDTYLRAVERDPELYRFLVSAADESSLGTAAVGSFVSHVAAQVGIVIGERIRAAGGDPAPAGLWANAIVGAVHQAGDHWLTERAMSRGEVCEHIVRLLWDGLGSVDTEGSGD